MGYDQHDSQEFATYLLDALHEDTNRVLKKPYIEKPEQEEDEPDDVAADKAWQLHLQREDSRVLENFMGQIKSRLECCTEGCDRVSTTFDPFMYLSVPIPGSTERKIDVTFIPLDPSNKWQKLAVTVSKTGKISDLMEKTNEKLVEAGFFEKPLPLSDLCVCDIWSHDVYSWRKADADVGTISDNDKTFVYQLESLEKIREATQEMDNDSIQKWESKATHREKLDVTTITDLNANEKWLDVLLDNFSRSRGGASHQIRSRDIRVRMTFHQKLENFLNECYEVVSKEESGGLKRAREDFDDEVAMDDDNEIVESENVLRGLVERSNASESFCNVRTKRDFAILEFCANKLRQMILGEIKKPSAGYQNGVIVQVSFTKETHYNDVESITSPLVVRVPCSMTVFEFRQLLAERLSRSLKVAHSVDDIDNSPNDLEMSSGELTEEVTETSPGEPATESNEKPLQQAQAELPEPSELLVIYRAALRYDKSGGQHGHRPNVRRRSTQPLGMVLLENDSSLAKVAVASDEAEKAVMETLGDHAIVTVEWTDAYREKVFDMDEYESQERLERSVEENIRTNCKEQPITVMDCIKKYCEKEQLEESEMWYCNKCKNHVRAWKQFSLHRTPPYLIIHLKRFYFASARRRDKISEFIDFPLEGLDLTELVADYKEETKPIYDCYAVSNHIGGLGGGHYTAYIWSDEDGSWSYYNDSAVTENVDRNDVVSAEAYVLYYRRRDIPVGEDKEYCFPASPRHSSSMICEQVDSPMDQRSVASGNDTAVADEDLDATLDDAISSASSGAATAPMASEDNVAPQENSENDIDDLYAKDSRERSDFPLQ
jgi:ubiquitin carboxyl-terminal hydrolase 4/11/15